MKLRGGQFAQKRCFVPPLLIPDAVRTHRKHLELGRLANQLYASVDCYKETLNQPTAFVPESTSPSINVYDPVYGRVPRRRRVQRCRSR
jgi:hypothetical protein